MGWLRDVGRGSATQMWLAVAGKDWVRVGMEYVKRWFIPDCLSMQRYYFFRHIRKTVGGSAQRCASRGMTYRIRGKGGKRWAAEMMSLATERFSPPPIFSLSLIRRRTSFRRERSEWRNIVVARARRKEYSPSESPGEARAIWLAAAHR